MRKFFARIGDVFKRIWDAIKLVCDYLYAIFFIILLIVFHKRLEKESVDEYE